MWVRITPIIDPWWTVCYYCGKDFETNEELNRTCDSCNDEQYT